MRPDPRQLLLRLCFATVTATVTVTALLGLARPAAAARVKVVTTIQTLRVLVDEVGGPHVLAVALVGEHVDPHRLDPRPSYAVTLSTADLLIHVGLELEKSWLPPLVAQARNPRIRTGAAGNLDASTAGIAIKTDGRATRASGDIHPLGNPHYWLTPDHALRIAHGIAARLAAIDPAHAADYQRRASDLTARVTARRAAWTERARPLAGAGVVSYHRSWSYLTEWLGLVEVGAIEPKPGVPPDPRHLAELVRTAKARGARLVLVEPYFPRNTAQRIAELGGMRLVVLPADASATTQSYVELVDQQLGLLAGAR